MRLTENQKLPEVLLMFRALLMKEIREAVRNSRYMVSLLLCLVMVPLAMYTAFRDYELRQQDWSEAQRLYQQRAESDVGADFQAEAYRPPSPLSVLALGIEAEMPNKAVTSRKFGVSLDKLRGVDNPQAALFGRLDLLFVVCYFLSLLALIFMYSGITSEKEAGTLRLMGASAAPRGAVYTAKLVGGFCMFMLPLLVSFLAGALLLALTGRFDPFSADRLASLAAFFAISALYLAVFLNLGLLVSSLTHSSVTAMVVVLLVWMALVLGVPRVAPMLAETLSPVESSQVAAVSRRTAVENLVREQEQQKWQLFVRLCQASGVEPRITNPTAYSEVELEAYHQYQEQSKALDREYEERIAEAVGRLRRDYESRREHQGSIAISIARLSPAGCYSFVGAEIARTGLLEMENFTRRAAAFQEQARQEIYDRYVIESLDNGQQRSVGAYAVEGAGRDQPLTAPQLHDYSTLSLREVLTREWLDILLLAAFNILFFAAGFARFLRYDFR